MPEDNEIVTFTGIMFGFDDPEEDIDPDDERDYDFFSEFYEEDL